MLYTDADIESSMDKIETLNFHQVDILQCYGIRSWSSCYM